MKVLVLGSGGREHAIVWKLKQPSHIKKQYCAPGSGGIAADAECVAARTESGKKLIAYDIGLPPACFSLGRIF